MILCSLREELRPILLRLLNRNAGSLGFCSQLVRQEGQPSLGWEQAACSQKLLPQPWNGCTHGRSCQSSVALHLHCRECIHLPAQTHSQGQQLLSSRRSIDLTGPVQCTHQPANRAALTYQPVLPQPCSIFSAAYHTKQNLLAGSTTTLCQARLSSTWRNFSGGRGAGTASGPHGIRAPDSSPLVRIQGQGSPIRGSSNSSSSGHSNTSAEGRAHKKRRRQTLPTWLHILRRKRHAREKGRAAAAVVRRAKRDGIMASPKGIRATSLTALRAAPVWPSVDIPTDLGEPAGASAPAASPWTHTASDLGGFSGSSSSSSGLPVGMGADAGATSNSSGKEAKSNSKRVSQDSEVAWSNSTSAGAGPNSPVVGARSSGKRVSQGRGGSASGRVWPMDPPELTEAISRCASLKGLAQILDVTEDMASASTPVSTRLPDRQQVFTPGLRLRAARLALQREMRALTAEREGRTRHPKRPSSSMPIILTAAFNQLAWLHTHSGSQPKHRLRARASVDHDQEHTLRQALLHWMFDQLSVVVPVLDARGASTIVGALGALRQSPPPETWASLVDRLLEPLPTTSQRLGKAGRGSGDQPGPRSGHRTLVEDMDVAQLVDLSAGLARLRAGNSQLWTAILKAAAAAAARQEIAPSQLPLLLQNVKRGCGVVGASAAWRSRGEGENGVANGLGASSDLEISRAEAGQLGQVPPSKNPHCSSDGVEQNSTTMSSGRGSPAEEARTEFHCGGGGRNAQGLVSGNAMQERASTGHEHASQAAGIESNSHYGEDASSSHDNASRAADIDFPPNQDEGASSGHEHASGAAGIESPSHHDEDASSGHEHVARAADILFPSHHVELANKRHEQAAADIESPLQHDEDDTRPCQWTHTDKQSHNEAHNATGLFPSPETRMELQRHRALRTLVAALPSLLPQMELKNIATTIDALRGLHLSLDPDTLHLLNRRVAFLLVKRQERRQRQADHAQLQQRLKEVAAGVLRSRKGDSQGEDSSQKSSRSTSISTSGEVGGMESRREDKRGKGSSMREIASETEGDKADARAVRMLCHNLAAWHAGNSRVWDLLRRG